jgi:carbonic anhydrase/acetyltransferase-like protein (isoleucine patch superfamily)
LSGPPRALVLPHRDLRPRLGADVFLAPTAVVVGDVRLGPRVSVWYGAVLRGDVHTVEVGEDSNVQDGAVLHGTLGEWPVVLGARVSVGHQATVHGAVVEDDCLIGIGARVLDGARIGAGSLVAAGALVREGMQVPPGSLVAGVPAELKRPLTQREREILARTPGRYLELARRARESLRAAGFSDGP